MVWSKLLSFFSLPTKSSSFIRLKHFWVASFSEEEKCLSLLAAFVLPSELNQYFQVGLNFDLKV